MQPAGISHELKQRIATLYLKNKGELEALSPTGLESFASEVLAIIQMERVGARSPHDLDVLEGSMKHLKRDAVTFENSEPGTDDYDFARSDCRSLLDSTKMWLRLEGLI
jgi:hypothetical protein